MKELFDCILAIQDKIPKDIFANPKAAYYHHYIFSELSYDGCTSTPCDFFERYSYLSLEDDESNQDPVINSYINYMCKCISHGGDYTAGRIFELLSYCPELYNKSNQRKILKAFCDKQLLKDLMNDRLSDYEQFVSKIPIIRSPAIDTLHSELFRDLPDPEVSNPLVKGESLRALAVLKTRIKPLRRFRDTYDFESIYLSYLSRMESEFRQESYNLIYLKLFYMSKFTPFYSRSL